MKISDSQKLFFCFTGTAMVMLLIGLGDLPYGYYTFLRIITAASMVWFCFVNFPVWGKFIFLMGAVLYNPVFPVHLRRHSKDTWRLFNVITVLLLCAGIVFVLYRLKREAKNGIAKTR